MSLAIAYLEKKDLLEDLKVIKNNVNYLLLIKIYW
jgi:hypothetical protein